MDKDAPHKLNLFIILSVLRQLQYPQHCAVRH